MRSLLRVVIFLQNLFLVGPVSNCNYGNGIRRCATPAVLMSVSHFLNNSIFIYTFLKSLLSWRLGKDSQSCQTHCPQDNGTQSQALLSLNHCRLPLRNQLVNQKQTMSLLEFTKLFCNSGLRNLGFLCFLFSPLWF